MPFTPSLSFCLGSVSLGFCPVSLKMVAKINCHLFQFHRQREAEGHHHLWGKWRLSPSWGPTVSVSRWRRILKFFISLERALVFIFCFFPSRYKNIPHMSFDDTGREPEQAFRLNRDPVAELEYPTKWEQQLLCSCCCCICLSPIHFVPVDPSGSQIDISHQPSDDMMPVSGAFNISAV